MLVVPPVTAAGSYAPDVQANDAMNVPMSDVDPSKCWLTPLAIPEGMVNAAPAVVCIPAPQAMTIAPVVTGWCDGASGLEAL